MAINSQKLLPSSTRGGSIIKSSSSIISSSKIYSKESKDTFLEIKVKVIEVDKILKGTLALKKKQLTDKKKSESSEGRKKQEEKLEKPSKGGKEDKKMLSLPRMGFLDSIKNFIGKILLGYFAYRLVEHLPKILPIINFIGSASDFIINVGGKLLNGLVTFIDWGYKAYDATRGFMKNMFGESGAKQFDQLAGLLNQFLNLALIVGMAGSGRPFGNRGGKPGVSKGGGSGPYKYDPKRALIRKKYGDSFAKLYDQEIAKGLNSEQARKNVLSRYVRKGRISPQRMTGSLGGTDAGSKLFGRGIQKVPGRLATKLLGKNALRVIKPIFRNIPIIGGLIEFGISWALGDPIGKAAFRGIGAGLVGAIGTAIGGPIGMAIGGFVGGEVGGALYDMFFGNKKPQPIADEAQGSAGGGITRGGRLQGGVKREIKKAPVKRQVKITPKKLKPGSSVGGNKQIEKIFPKSEDKKTVNPLGYVEKFYDGTSDVPFFGPLFSIATKTLLGDKPTQVDYKNAGSGLNNWMNTTFNTQVMRGGFAGGGEVNAEMFFRGEDLTNAITKSLEDNISKKIEDSINDLQKQLGLKGFEGVGPDKSDPTLEGDDELPPGGLTEGQWGPLLDLIAGKESGGNYEAMYPSTTLKGATKMTISEVARRATGAVGKYQQLPQYLVGRAKAAGLNPDKDLYSPENQERIIINVNIKGRGGARWLKGEISDEQFMQGLSQEFASLPNAQGKFYYTGQRSAMTPAKVKAALSKVKKGGYSQADFASASGSLGTEKVGAVDQFTSIAKKFGLQLTSDYRPGDSGYHGKNRARDYSNDGVGNGTPEQLKFAQHLVKNYGSSLSQLIYTPLGFGIANGKKVGLDYWGASTNSQHYHHVHVALKDGGLVDGVTYAMLGERGREFVIDADSTAALEQKFPGFLDALNKANYDGAINVLRSYTEYERISTEIVYVPFEVPVPMDSSYGSSGFDLSFSADGEQTSPFDTLYSGW